MIQEVNPDHDYSNARTLPILDRSNQRSLKVDTPVSLPPLTFTRSGPKFPNVYTYTSPEDVKGTFANKVKLYYIWCVPALGGFGSATAAPPPRKSTIDFCTPKHQPITESAVVRELLKWSEQATTEVGQEWVINTFDLGVCMKALPI